jgi:hypothetical protein
VVEELSPKHFSFNSHLGACEACEGLGTEMFCDPALLAEGEDAEKTLKRYREAKSEITRRKLAKFMAHRACGVCGGKRLKAEWLAVKILGGNIEHRALNIERRREEKEEWLGIQDFCEMSVADAMRWIEGIEFEAGKAEVCKRLASDVRTRLAFLVEVGLDYLTLQRTSGTLSGGEAQRIRLATQLGAGLSGVIYVLDEPSIGLHAADTARRPAGRVSALSGPSKRNSPRLRARSRSCTSRTMAASGGASSSPMRETRIPSTAPRNSPPPARRARGERRRASWRRGRRSRRRAGYWCRSTTAPRTRGMVAARAPSSRSTATRARRVPRRTRPPRPRAS